MVVERFGIGIHKRSLHRPEVEAVELVQDVDAVLSFDVRTDVLSQPAALLAQRSESCQVLLAHEA